MLHEWKSDTYATTALHYNLRAIVVDAAGKQIGDGRIEGTDNLGAGLAARDTGPTTAFGQKIRELFRSPSIANAL